MNDLKFAFRQLLKNPGFAAVAARTLALGIGASWLVYFHPLADEISEGKEAQGKSAQALIRACLIAARSFAVTAPSRLSNLARGSAPTACTLATESGSRNRKWPEGISSALPRDCRVTGTWMINVLGASRSSASSTTTGRVLPAMPRSADHTSPWLGCMAVNDVQDFLLDFAARQHVRPLFLLPLAFQELQIMPYFPKHFFRLLPDFFDQPFLRDHAWKLNGPGRIGKLLSRSLSKRKARIPTL